MLFTQRLRFNLAKSNLLMILNINNEPTSIRCNFYNLSRISIMSNKHAHAGFTMLLYKLLTIFSTPFITSSKCILEFLSRSLFLVDHGTPPNTVPG
jgi:hypothetical protein